MTRISTVTGSLAAAPGRAAAAWRPGRRINEPASGTGIRVMMPRPSFFYHHLRVITGMIMNTNKLELLLLLLPLGLGLQS